MLYKYRTITNIMFLLDILLNKRLYASTFDALNDPMEGHFRYRRSKVGRDLLRDVRSLKKELRICSLSKKANDTLMWSYYGDSHKGVAVGVEVVDDSDYDIRPVIYRQRAAYVSSSMAPDKAARKLLSSKLLPWEHEQEVRVLTHEEFVEVDVIELVFGIKTDKHEISLLKKLARKFGINSIRQMTKSELKEFA
ncbi:MAG: DUF2971 domain-containing protein [Candidatus Hodarchaeota archaeon]